MLVLAFVSPIEGQTIGDWEAGQALPEGRFGLHASTLNESIYVMGGTDGLERSDARSEMWQFDTNLQQWEKHDAMPTARVFFDTAVIGNMIYAVGGSMRAAEGAPSVAAVEMFDTGANSWKLQTELPTSRADLVVNTVDGKLYAIGGARQVGLNALGTVEEYNPVTDVWTRKMDMPTPRLHMSSVVVDNKIFVLGGGPEWPVPTATVEIYNPEKLGQLRQPTMIVSGADGYVYDSMMVERAVHCMPNAVQATLQGVTHDGPHRKPEELAKMINSFLGLVVE